jgi:hypothetical protein
MTATRPRRPDGIDDNALDTGRGVSRHASVLSLILLGAVLAVGLSGFAGGRTAHHSVRGDGLDLSITSPALTRTGNVIETRLQLTTDKPIGRLVIGIEPTLWRELTTNATVPTAADESYADGLFRFEYGPIGAGQKFELQIAQQVNPSRIGVNRGRLVVLDDQRRLAAIALRLIVLP